MLDAHRRRALITVPLPGGIGSERSWKDAVMATSAEIRSTLGDWFDAQGTSCAALGSPLYANLFPAVGGHVRAGRYDALLAPIDRWRVGDAMPLRVMGAAHFLALSGAAPTLAAAYPSCGGTVPDPIPADALAESLLDRTARSRRHPPTTCAERCRPTRPVAPPRSSWGCRPWPGQPRRTPRPARADRSRWSRWAPRRD
jgi:hypothetical protein